MTLAIDEEARYALYRRLEEVLGQPYAGTMIASLPPVPWSDFATKRDLEALEARITGRFDRLEGTLDRRFGEIDARFGEIGRRFGEIDRRFGEVDARFGEVDARFGEMFARQADWARTVLYANLGAVIATASLAFAAARL